MSRDPVPEFEESLASIARSLERIADEPECDVVHSLQPCRPHSQIEIRSDMGDIHYYERWSDKWFYWLGTDDRSEEVAGALHDIAEHLGWLDEQEKGVADARAK